jgi:hypothetical protein
MRDRGHRSRSTHRMSCVSSELSDTRSRSCARGPAVRDAAFRRQVPDEGSYFPHKTCVTRPSRSVTHVTWPPSTGHAVEIIAMTTFPSLSVEPLGDRCAVNRVDRHEPRVVVSSNDRRRNGSGCTHGCKRSIRSASPAHRESDVIRKLYGAWRCYCRFFVSPPRR